MIVEGEIEYCYNVKFTIILSSPPVLLPFNFLQHFRSHNVLVNSCLLNPNILHNQPYNQAFQRLINWSVIVSQKRSFIHHLIIFYISYHLYTCI